MAGGRPLGADDYLPEYDEIAIRMGKENKTRAEIAAEIGCSTNTLKTWTEKHPSFFGAVEYGQTHSEAIMNKQGRDGLWEIPGQPKLNTRAYEFIMQNRFGMTKKIEQTIDLGIKDLSKMTTEQLIEQYQKAQK